MSSIVHCQDDAPATVLANVAENVRRVRQERELSQAALAERSGISRRMIASVENDEANLSLSSLDRLAAALGTSLAALIREPDRPDNRRIDGLAWQGAQPESRATLLGTAPATREAELWLWSLAEGERYPSESGSGGWHEMLFVLEGVLVIEAADGNHQVNEGDFLIFSSERPYIFANGGLGVVKFIRSVVL